MAAPGDDDGVLEADSHGDIPPASGARPSAAGAAKPLDEDDRRLLDHPRRLSREGPVPYM